MENLQAQYDQLASYLGEYPKFIRRFTPRLVRLMIKSPREYHQINMKFWRMVWRTDLLSEKTQNINRHAVYALATDEEKTTAFFKVATSDYPTDTLSDSLKREFPAFQFEKLKKVHGLKQSQLTRFSLRQVIGVVLAASTLTLKSIPKSVVEANWMAYEEFEVMVFWATVIVAGYLLFILLPAWWMYSRARRKSQQVGDILEYTAIKYG